MCALIQVEFLLSFMTFVKQSTSIRRVDVLCNKFYHDRAYCCLYLKSVIVPKWPDSVCRSIFHKFDRAGRACRISFMFLSYNPKIF